MHLFFFSLLFLLLPTSLLCTLAQPADRDIDLLARDEAWKPIPSYMNCAQAYFRDCKCQFFASEYFDVDATRKTCEAYGSGPVYSDEPHHQCHLKGGIYDCDLGNECTKPGKLEQRCWNRL